MECDAGIQGGAWKCGSADVLAEWHYVATTWKEGRGGSFCCDHAQRCDLVCIGRTSDHCAAPHLATSRRAATSEARAATTKARTAASKADPATAGGSTTENSSGAGHTTTADTTRRTTVQKTLATTSASKAGTGGAAGSGQCTTSTHDHASTSDPPLIRGCITIAIEQCRADVEHQRTVPHQPRATRRSGVAAAPSARALRGVWPTMRSSWDRPS